MCQPIVQDGLVYFTQFIRTNFLSKCFAYILLKKIIDFFSSDFQYMVFNPKQINMYE